MSRHSRIRRVIGFGAVMVLSVLSYLFLLSDNRNHAASVKVASREDQSRGDGRNAVGGSNGGLRPLHQPMAGGEANAAVPTSPPGIQRPSADKVLAVMESYPNDPNGLAAVESDMLACSTEEERCELLRAAYDIRFQEQAHGHGTVTPPTAAEQRAAAEFARRVDPKASPEERDRLKDSIYQRHQEEEEKTRP